jgi:hypothetical protein
LDGKIICGVRPDKNVDGVFASKIEFNGLSSRLAIVEAGYVVKKIKIVASGDSLTANLAYTNYIAAQMGTAAEVYNGGVGGENAPNIVARMGGLLTKLKNAVTIPLDTSWVTIGDLTDSGVSIIMPSGATTTMKWLLQGQGQSTINPIFVEGIECTLSWSGSAYNDPAGVYRIKRNVAALANYTTQAGAVVHTNAMKIYKNADLKIIWIGQNGGWANEQELTDLIRKDVEFANVKNYVVVGLHSGTAASRAALETKMEAEFGVRYINWRKYCVERALTDLAITPTTPDTNAIAVGSCPPSLLTDSVHMTTAAYELLGKLIMNKIKYFGIWNA